MNAVESPGHDKGKEKVTAHGTQAKPFAPRREHARVLDSAIQEPDN